LCACKQIIVFLQKSNIKFMFALHFREGFGKNPTDTDHRHEGSLLKNYKQKQYHLLYGKTLNATRIKLDCSIA